LAEGYYQVPIAEEDKFKTAFITEFGLFQFNVMPFGVTNAPATFQRMMAKVLKPHIDSGLARVYLDDVAVKSGRASSHEEDVLLVCGDIDANQLKLKLNKCTFTAQGGDADGALALQDFYKPFTFMFDACDIGIGGWISQRDAQQHLRLELGFDQGFFEKSSNLF